MICILTWQRDIVCCDRLAESCLHPVDGVAVRLRRRRKGERRSVASQFSYRYRKAIPASRNRQNVLRVIRMFVEDFPQGGDMAGEIVFLHHGIGPNLLHNFVFLHHLPAMPDQKEQQFEGLQADWNDLSLPQQDRLLRINEERAELVETCGGLVLYRFHSYSGTFQVRFKNFSGIFQNGYKDFLRDPEYCYTK